MTGPRKFTLENLGEGTLDLQPLVSHLRDGGLVAMPTETVYGFGCLMAERPLAILQEWKARGPEKPFLVLIPGPEDAPTLAWNPEARELARVFWPGALTLVLNDPEGSFPPGVRSRQGGVAVRVSPHPLIQFLMDVVRSPLVSTSANRPGGSPARSAGEALEEAVALGADESLWILDGGFLEPSEPSTIIDCTGAVPKLLRAGAIPVNRVRCVLPEIHAS